MLSVGRLTILLLSLSLSGCGGDSGPAVALINTQIECMNALAEGMTKVTDEASGTAALPALKPIAERLGRARTELAELSRREAWIDTVVQSQGPRLMAATSRLQQETLRLAQVPGTSKFLLDITKAMSSPGR